MTFQRPFAGAVHLNHTDGFVNPLAPAWSGSPASVVASALVPLMEGVRVSSASALARLSLAGGAASAVPAWANIAVKISTAVVQAT